MREHRDVVASLDQCRLMPALLRADCAGDRVPAGLRGRIHSVFDRACNIATERGDLVTLLAPASGNVPHGIRLTGAIAPFRSWLVPGCQAMLRDSTLHFPDAGVGIDLSGADRWCGRVTPASRVTGGAAFTTALHALRATVIEDAPVQGITPMLAMRDTADCTVTRALAVRLSKTLPVLACATARRDVPAVTGAMAKLVGLGPGLTPSGDDFIAGYLAALWSRAGDERDLEAILRPLADSLSSLFLRTNAISRQMLNDAVRGHFAQHLAEVTVAIAVAGDVVGATARALTSGHSSGADTLCGLLFGYLPDLVMPAVSSLPHCVERKFAFQRDAGFSAAIACSTREPGICLPFW